MPGWPYDSIPDPLPLEDLADGLAGAIARVWSEQALEAVAGPLRGVRAKGSQPPPYTALSITGGRAALRTSGDPTPAARTVNEHRVTFQAKSTDSAEAAHAAAKALAAVYDDAYLAWDGGASGQWVREEWSDGSDPKWGQGTNVVFWVRVTYRVRVRGSR